nr:hypothetical protein Iba_chr03bCG10910 [Ipomoea batatas]
MLTTFEDLYTGIFTVTITPLRLTCGRNSGSKPSFMAPQMKLNRFSNASVDVMVNMRDDELPNSMISCWYLFSTSLSITLPVTVNNAVSENPNCLLTVSKNAKKYAVVLRIIHILCRFHHDFTVSPLLNPSANPYPFLAA